MKALLVLLVLVLPGCSGLSEKIKGYTSSIGASFCDRGEELAEAGGTALGAILPPFVVKPATGVLSFAINFACETAGLAVGVSGEALGAAADPVGGLVEMGEAVISPFTSEEADPEPEPDSGPGQ